MSVSDFFENTLGAKLANRMWSWGAIDTANSRIFLRVWSDEIEPHNGAEHVVILREPRQSSPGYRERESQIAAMNGANSFGVILNPKFKDGSRSIKDFDQTTLLRLGPLLKLPDRLLARIDGRIPVEELNSEPDGSTLADDLGEILLTPSPDRTTIKALVDARIGQGQFRQSVLKLWNGRCAVTGATTLVAIRASHIKPWRSSTNAERLDPHNGLPLVASLDSLFDAGLISFDTDGQMRVSPSLSRAEQSIFGLGKSLLRKPSGATAEYLEHHWAEIFKG